MKLPKKKTTAEWIELVDKNIENLAHRHYELGEVIEHILGHTSTDLDEELLLLKSYHYITYLNHYITSLVTDPKVGIPSEVLVSFTEDAMKMAEKELDVDFETNGKSIKEEYLDPEDRVTQRGGDA